MAPSTMEEQSPFQKLDREKNEKNEISTTIEIAVVIIVTGIKKVREVAKPLFFYCIGCKIE